MQMNPAPSFTHPAWLGAGGCAAHGGGASFALGGLKGLSAELLRTEAQAHGKDPGDMEGWSSG